MIKKSGFVEVLQLLIKGLDEASKKENNTQATDEYLSNMETLREALLLVSETLKKKAGAKEGNKEEALA